MRFFHSRFGAIFFASIAITSDAFAAQFHIRDGDRVVFLGDSITEQRLYTTYIEAYALTRFPEWRLTFRNVGWGGDTSWLRQRARPDEKQLFAADESKQQTMVEDSVGRGLARDVIPLKPTFVTVKFGMNDHSYQPFREDIFRAYTRSQAQIAKVLGGNGARVTFLTPQPIEDKRADPDKDPRNQSLRRFSDGLKDVAARSNAAFVDQFDPYMSLMMAARGGNPTAIIGGGDAVHPGPSGQTLMAWAVLKGLSAPGKVSTVEIDAASQKVTSAEGCKVTQLKVPAGGGVSFERLDDALPMPVDSRAESALKLAPVLADLSQYELRIKGLPKGVYELKIDGETTAKFTSEELAQGSNLTLTAGAITKQSQDILAAVFKKNDLFFTRWRQVQLHDFPAWAKSAEVEARRSAELARLDQLISEQEARVSALRKPKPHRFELSSVSP